MAMEGLLVTSCCAHRSVSHSASTTEASWCSTWALTQKPTARHSAESGRLRSIRSSKGCLHQSSPSGLRELSGRDRMEWKSERGWRTPRKRCLPHTAGLTHIRVWINRDGGSKHRTSMCLSHMETFLSHIALLGLNFFLELAFCLLKTKQGQKQNPCTGPPLTLQFVTSGFRDLYYSHLICIWPRKAGTGKCASSR